MSWFYQKKVGRFRQHQALLPWFSCHTGPFKLWQTPDLCFQGRDQMACGTR